MRVLAQALRSRPRRPTCGYPAEHREASPLRAELSDALPTSYPRINIAANALQINGQRTAEISDRFDVFVIPAGYVFSIWGLVSPKWRKWWLLLPTVEFP